MPDKKKQIDQVRAAMESLAWCPQPSLGIDIDGCVDEAPLFFTILTHSWPGKVFVITYRNDRAKAEQVLADYDIRYDELILVSSFDAKAEVILEKGILVFFDDLRWTPKTGRPNKV